MQQAVLLQAAHEVVALAGFHIKRQEFEPEYDNEAEMIVADMEFRDDDTEVGLHACTFLSRREPESVNTITVVGAFWLMIIVVTIVVVNIILIVIIIMTTIIILYYNSLCSQ